MNGTGSISVEEMLSAAAIIRRSASVSAAGTEKQPLVTVVMRTAAPESNAVILLNLMMFLCTLLSFNVRRTSFRVTVHTPRRHEEADGVDSMV